MRTEPAIECCRAEEGKPVSSATILSTNSYRYSGVSQMIPLQSGFSSYKILVSEELFF